MIELEGWIEDRLAAIARDRCRRRRLSIETRWRLVAWCILAFVAVLALLIR